MNFILPRVLQLIDQKRFNSDYSQGLNFGYGAGSMLGDASSLDHRDSTTSSSSSKSSRRASQVTSMNQSGSKQVQEHDLKICKEAL